MMPVILVSLEHPRSQDGKVGLGITSIAASLEHAGIPWQIIEAEVNSDDFSLDKVHAELMKAIEEVGPDCLIGFGTYVWNDVEVRALTEMIWGMGATIVLGGPQISYTGNGQLEGFYPKANYFVRGHGEMALVNLANGVVPLNSGIHVAGTTDLGTKAEHDLMALPSPYLLGTIELRENIRWETQRGCPYQCSFCQHRAPGKWDKSAGVFDEKRLKQELDLFAAANVKRISVLDPIFHVDISRATRILKMIKDAGVKAEISLQCRFETCTPKFLDALAGLNVTLEFGLQTIIDSEYHAIRRPNKMNKVVNTVHELKQRRIDFEVSLIYGLPNQTSISFKKSIDWCGQHRVPRVRAWPLMLLRGTPLNEKKELYGFRESTNQRIPIVVSSNTFTEAEHAEMERIACDLEEG